MTDKSLRHLLRSATAAAHQRLDDAVSHDLDYGPDSYVRFLRGLARGIVPIEEALEHAGIETVVGDWPERRRTLAMTQDLADFGEAIPTTQSSITLDGLPEAIGALYVLEGSRLGSQLLLKQALASESAIVRSATRHLAHGQCQKFWPSFVAILDSCEAAQNEPDRVVAGANLAFAFIQEAFTTPAVGRLETDLRMDAVTS